MASIINAATSGGLISTADTSGILQLQTAGTAAVTVDASQNVGVGTASPTEKIHVAGALRVTGAQTTAGTGVYLQQASGTGGVSVYGPDNSTQGTFIVYSATANGGTGSTKATIDSSGNLGLGVTPSIYWGGNRGLDVGSPGCGLTSRQNNEINLCQNTAFNVYAVSGIPASRFGIGNNGAFVWNQAPVGTAGNTPTFTTVMTLDTSGNLLVGGTSQSGTANRTAVFSANKFGLSVIDTTAQAAGVGGALNLGGNYRSAGDAQAFARVSAVKQNSTDADYGYGMAFSVTPNGGTFTEAARIDSSGNLLVGTTSTVASGKLQVVTSGGSNVVNWSASTAAEQQAQFSLHAQDGARSASFGLYRNGSADAAAYINFTPTNNGSSSFVWSDTSGVLRIGSSSLIGTTSGTVIGTQTSDERLKTIDNLFPYGLDTVQKLTPIRFILNGEQQQRLGFGAQSTQPHVPEVVYDSGECIDGYDQNPDNTMKVIPKSNRTKLVMDNVQIIPVLVKAIQEQQALIQSLKARLDAANL